MVNPNQPPAEPTVTELGRMTSMIAFSYRPDVLSMTEEIEYEPVAKLVKDGDQVGVSAVFGVAHDTVAITVEP